jgi:uncharacterized protein
MRLSHYVTLSDRICADAGDTQVRVVLHSLSGEVYVLPEEILQVVLSDPAALPDAVAAELAGAGLLVPDDTDEFTPVVQENIEAARDVSMRRFVLMPTAYCNMGCGYCGQRHSKGPQTREHRDAVKARILEAVGAPTTTSLEIGWFGAEPMMGYAQILDISATVSAACDERGVAFAAKMVTNGSLLTLDRIRVLYKDCRVRAIEITLDGARTSHDTQRPLKNGRSSFDRIVARIREACEDPELAGLAFSIRTNVSRTNQDDHAAFATSMREAGLAQPNVSFYTALVRPWGNDVSDYAIREEDVVEVERRWLDAYQDNGLLMDLIPLGRRKVLCAAVTRATEVVDPTGAIHSCTEQPLVPDREHTALAHITELPTPELRPPGLYDTWNQDLLAPQTPVFCPTCAIFPICGGSCPLVWHEGRPACPPLKQTLPMRLTMYGETLGLRVL